MLLPFVVLALILHISAFYVIEIRYPATQREIPVRTDLMLLSESSLSDRERAALEFWTEMNDPSRMIVPAGPLLTRAEMTLKWNARENFPTAPQRPEGSLATASGSGGDTSVRDLLASIPRPAGAARSPGMFSTQVAASQRDTPDAGGPVPRVYPPSMVPLFSEGWPTLQERVTQGMTPPRQDFPYPAPAQRPAAAASSFAVLDAEGDARLVANTIPALPNPPYDPLAALGTTVLSLGVDESGRVRSVIVAESCGRPAIDQQAVAALRRAQFRAAAAAEPGIAWIQCHVYWRFTPASADTRPAQPRPEAAR